MTEENEAFEELAKRQGDWGLQGSRKHQIMRYLENDAMREVQRLGQEIEQEPVAIKRMKEWIEYLKRKSDFGQHMKIPSEMSAGTCWELAIELEQFINTTPPQRTEQNFCPRCGKRTKDIHTCTPPKENT